ncbi:unnamed protein product [Boreogadus saida]
MTVLRRSPLAEGSQPARLNGQISQSEFKRRMDNTIPNEHLSTHLYSSTPFPCSKVTISSSSLDPSWIRPSLTADLTIINPESYGTPRERWMAQAAHNTCSG